MRQKQERSCRTNIYSIPGTNLPLGPAAATTRLIKIDSPSRPWLCSCLVIHEVGTYIFCAERCSRFRDTSSTSTRLTQHVLCSALLSSALLCYSLLYSRPKTARSTEFGDLDFLPRNWPSIGQKQQQHQESQQRQRQRQKTNNGRRPLTSYSITVPPRRA